MSNDVFFPKISFINDVEFFTDMYFIETVFCLNTVECDFKPILQLPTNRNASRSEFGVLIYVWWSTNWK